MSRPVLTIYLPKNRRAQNQFLRYWIVKGKLRLKRVVKDGIPVPDARGDAYSVNGDPATVARMLRDRVILAVEELFVTRLPPAQGQTKKLGSHSHDRHR